MGAESHIEWTDATWNPLVGCTKVSPGCEHCYAETLVNRFAGHNTGFPNRFDVVTQRPQLLDKPLHWRKPKLIFVNSLSDLFHVDVPDDYIAQVFAVMRRAHWHTFQLLTKRHGRMRSLLSSEAFGTRVHEIAAADAAPFKLNRFWPLPHVWLGVSVENQKWADIRIPALLDTPAAIRFISAEPLLGHITLTEECGYHDAFSRGGRVVEKAGYLIDGLDWVIAGGESGKDARPMHPDWPRDLQRECEIAEVPFVFKQWGEWGIGGSDIRAVAADGTFCPTRGPLLCTSIDRGHLHAFMSKMGKRKSGRELDGELYDGYPA